MKKKIVAFLLAATMAFSLAACGNSNEVTPDSGSNTNQSSTETPTTPDSTEGDDADATESTDRPDVVEEVAELKTQEEVLAMIPDVAPSGQVIVGSETSANADMFRGWSNSAANASFKRLMEGYSVLTFTKEGRFEYDPIVVKSYDETVNADGTKTFTFEIYDNLTYNEGTKITAKDYVFNAMLGASPQFGEVDASNIEGYEIVGYENFNKGYLVNADGFAVDNEGNVIEERDEEGNSTFTADVVPVRTFSGIRLLGDYSFSVTVKAEELPYFYDKTLVDIAPAPMFAIAPGVDITDDGNGVTITDNFTADLLRETLLDPEKGFRYKNPISPGSYMLESYDPADNTTVLVANPYFLGHYDGTKPQIEKIIYKTVQEATKMDELSVGSVELLNGINGGDLITTGLDIVDAGNANYVTYPRAGYGKIALSCDFGPTQFVEVRQAMAWLLDRDEFVRQFTGGYGSVVYGYYGLSQWEYKENKDILDETLTHYTLNVEKAKELLISGGWTLNKDGQPFVEGTDTLRYKDVDGELMPLSIQWCSSDNIVSQMLRSLYVPNVAEAGMEIVETIVDFNTLLANVYRTNIDQPTYHMFNLATGFSEISAVWYYYSQDPKFLGQYNSAFLLDDEIENLTLDMKRTDSTDLDGWSSKWVQFQQRWNYLSPEIPLYSDEYHDFFNPKIQGYDAGPLWQWHYAIQRASVTQ